MKLASFLLLTLAAAAVPASAQQASLQPGEYLDGNGGYLLIKPGKEDSLPFSLRSVGANGHSCEADGRITKNRQAMLKQDDGGTCTLSFVAKADGIEVGVKTECRGFCGARATLDGMYLKPAQGCDRAGVRKARRDFKGHYDKKAYAEARAVLEPVMKRCQKTLDNREEAWIRNDLAITHLRLGDAAECREVLKPLADDAAKTDAQLREDLPPFDADNTVRIARATRTNLKLCQAQAAKGKP